MMKRLMFLWSGVFLTQMLVSQVVLTGWVKNQKGEPLVSASVVLDDGKNGTVTNAEGFFQISNVSRGNHSIQVAFLGYEPQIQNVGLLNDAELVFELVPTDILTEEVFVYATRGNEKTPMAKALVTKEKIAERNLGQDVPYLLSLTPSFVVTSDAGTGIGYTGFRIRGTDANRINVTINGIPVNDAESHGVFWVNMPDFSSSVENVQIQRGAGSSTNGAGAFGGTINMQSSGLRKEGYAHYSATVGSFRTIRNSVSIGSGLMNNHFTFDARLSKIQSDGYVDRAASDLKSFYLSGGYYANNTILKLNLFSGKEKTYQSWNGVPSVRLKNDEEGMAIYRDHWLWSGSERVNQIKYNELIHSNSRTYNYYTYDNETDNYQQDHYQLLFSHQFSNALNLNAALHYTYGRGYYEIEELDAEFADYGLNDFVVGLDTTFMTDMITQKWLDNDFYGGVFSVNYRKGPSDLTLGGGWNQYNGRHFGKIIWAAISSNADKDFEWYRGTGVKTDMNVYLKYNHQVSDALILYGDLQYRNIEHEITGIDDDLRDIAQSHAFDFLNPKAGVMFQPGQMMRLYASWAIAHREPNRSNYVDADPSSPEPTSERLHDFELGIQFMTPKATLGLNGYYMWYQDQLILTGEINDVGSAIMTNVDNSFRAGIEIMTGIQVRKNLEWNLNLTLSQNKIRDFYEHIDNWDTGVQETIRLGTVDIAFSPNVTGNSQIQYSPFKNARVSLASSYVGKQFIDNTSSHNRTLDAYWVNNLNFSYSFHPGYFKELKFSLAFNNILNEEYESNAWVYSYIYGNERYKMDGYFPQAGINILAGLSISF